MTEVLSPMSIPQRRRWPVFLPFGFVIVLAALWTGFWFFASARAETTLAGWREREAKAGRVYSCDKQSVGGYPFRFEVRCAEPIAELRGDPPVALKAKDLLAAVQVYDPGLVVGEIKGPLTIGEPGKPPTYVANWTLGQSSVRGTPEAPERVSFAFEAPTVERVADGGNVKVFNAERAEVHGRLAGGSVTDNPIIDLAMLLQGASAQELHPAAKAPSDVDIVANLRGLKDFSPKPWPDRFREIQAANGQIEIVKARVQQDDVHRGRRRQAWSFAQWRAQRATPDHGGEPRQGAEEARHRPHDVRRPGGVDLRRARQDHAGPRQPGAPERAQPGRLARPAHRAGRQARGGAAAAVRRRCCLSRAVPGRPDAAAVLRTTAVSSLSSAQLASRPCGAVTDNAVGIPARDVLVSRTALRQGENRHGEVHLGPRSSAHHGSGGDGPVVRAHARRRGDPHDAGRCAAHRPQARRRQHFHRAGDGGRRRQYPSRRRPTGASTTSACRSPASTPSRPTSRPRASSSPASRPRYGPARRVCFIRGPEGVSIELLERSAA